MGNFAALEVSLIVAVTRRFHHLRITGAMAMLRQLGENQWSAVARTACQDAVVGVEVERNNSAPVSDHQRWRY